MAKLFMIQTALQNLTVSGEAEVQGAGWRILLVNENILFVDCGDEGFTYQVYYADDGAWSVVEPLESVSELKELMAV